MAEEPKDNKPKRKKFNVLVRHSPFFLKNLDVEADSPEQAKELFLQACKEKHEARARQAEAQKGVDQQTAREAGERVREAYKTGIANLNSYEWSIRPAADVEADRKKLFTARERLRQRFLAPEEVAV